MNKLARVFVLVISTITLMYTGLAVLSLVAQYYFNGSASQVIITLALGVSTPILLTSMGVAIMGFMVAAWLQGVKDRSIFTLPPDIQQFHKTDTTKPVALLSLGKQISGVEVLPERHAQSSIAQIGNTSRQYTKAQLLMPTARRNNQLLDLYLQRKGENGDERH